MSAQIGDKIMILSQEPGHPVRQGEIREIRNNPEGICYLVQWLDTHHESVLPHGPDVVIKHRRGGKIDPDAVWAAPWRSWLRHPREWRHSPDPEQRQRVRDEQLAQRVETIIAGLGLTQTSDSISGSKIVYIPQVVSMNPGPPPVLDIHILPGQSPADFSAHATTIAFQLGVAEVRVVPLGPALIQLKLLPHNPLPGHPLTSQ